MTGSAHRRDLYYAARPWTTPCTSSSPTRSAATQPWRFNGGAAVYDPEGRPLGRGADDGEAVIVGEFDPAELARVRAAHRMLADRRAELGGDRALLTG